MDDAYMVLGVNIKGMAVAFGGDDLDALIALAKPLVFYSVYQNKPGFHSTTQKRFLVLQRNDPQWANDPTLKGVRQ